MRKGQGKIEVIACSDEILDLLRKGYPITRIHGHLVGIGKISASPQQFDRLVNKLVRPLVEKPTLGALRPPVEAAPSRSQQGHTEKPHHFPQPIQWDPTRKGEWK